MQKLLPVVLALFAMTVFVGFAVVLTRTGASWPRSIRPLDWWRLTGTTADEESVSVEAPAE